MRKIAIIVSREASGAKKQEINSQYPELVNSFIFLPNEMTIILSLISENPGCIYIVIVEKSINGKIEDINSFAKIIKIFNGENKVICYDHKEPVNFINLDGFIKLTSFENDLKTIVEMVSKI